MDILTIKSICTEFNIKDYTINDDYSIDVNSNVSITRTNIKQLPLKFRHVYGNFSCYNNKLTTLFNSPDRISGDFICSFNRLKSLEYSPYMVCGDFYCHGNKIGSIIQGPTYIIGNFYSDRTNDEGLIYDNNEPILKISNYLDYRKQINRSETIKRILNSKQI